MLVFGSVNVWAAPDKPFTVAEEIGLAHFGDLYGGQAQAVQFSPNGRYFAALSERGRLDVNRPEDTLKVFGMQDVLSALRRVENSEPPAPLWTLIRSTDKDGPLITRWRWLKDSSGIAFLERGARGSTRLMLADLKTMTIEPLTPEGQIINAFDIRDREHYAYAVADPGLLRRAAAEDQAAAIVGTGRTLLQDLLFSVDEYPTLQEGSDRYELWAVTGDRPFRVKNQASGELIVLFSEGLSNLALSPDGESLITALAVAEVPSAWEQLYPPPWAAYPYRLHAGSQDLATFMGYRLASRYVQIGLRNGTVHSLSDAPTGTTLGWRVGGSPEWSEDGKAIVLPSAFVARESHGSARACVAVVSASTTIPSCVEPIEAPNGSYERYRYVDEARFADARGDRLVVSYYSGDGAQGTTEYRRTLKGAWTVARRLLGADRAASRALEVSVRQGLNDPPVLLATNSTTRVSRVIWDPNPQLKDIALGEATVYRWKDKAGRGWKGGLFKPVPYEPGRRYPLVIQTHGFADTEFRPSGLFPTAFAARALAGAGIVVLQAEDCPIKDTPEEAPCNVGGYEAAASELVKQGLVDSERIGIVGFSRTCFYVMETLTTSTLHVKAASITDGVMGDYLQHLLAVDEPGISEFGGAIMGAQPFGMGLQLWLKRSPLFNMDKVNAALQVVAEGRSSLPSMWGPYAAMRYLHKPVDLILLNNDEHVLSNPGARLVSQGGTVDWMRFWLQDYEDPDPEKVEQYRRWRELRRIQQDQNLTAETAAPAAPRTSH